MTKNGSMASSPPIPLLLPPIPDFTKIGKIVVKQLAIYRSISLNIFDMMAVDTTYHPLI
jgi:hypothetical protein